MRGFAPPAYDREPRPTTVIYLYAENRQPYFLLLSKRRRVAPGTPPLCHSRRRHACQWQRLRPCYRPWFWQRVRGADAGRFAVDYLNSAVAGRDGAACGELLIAVGEVPASCPRRCATRPTAVGGFVGAVRGAQQCGENSDRCRVFYPIGQSLPQSGAARVFPAGIADYGPFFLAQRCARRAARFPWFRLIGGHLFRFLVFAASVCRGASPSFGYSAVIHPSLPASPIPPGKPGGSKAVTVQSQCGSRPVPGRYRHPRRAEPNSVRAKNQYHREIAKCR